MTWLYLVIGILVVAALVAVGLVTGGRRRRPAPPTTSSAPHAPEAGVPTPPSEETTVEPTDEPAAVTTLERPEGTASRLVRLRQRLAGSQGGLGRGLLSLLSRDRLDEDTWEAIEDTLLTADVGVAPTQQLVEQPAHPAARRRQGGRATRAPSCATSSSQLVDPTWTAGSRSSGADGKPGVVLVVGVNGTGKTTTVGKLARILVAEDRSVVLGAADTFRAAAVDQLATWGERVGVDVVRGPEGTDPASVAFQAVQEGIDRGPTPCSSTPPAACRTRRA